VDDLTRTSGEAAAAGTLTSSCADWGRFAPGTIFAGRFRIVAPLGRGGIGEVYRADDLKLGQTAALKLLPDHLARDPARLAQFHNEVRVARTISHRNVCRTYDIGDADGRPFLTMEHVDGEDLASLLRRIGRFPQDKAVEVELGLVLFELFTGKRMFEAKTLNELLALHESGALTSLVFAVLLRFGLLALLVMFYTFLLTEVFPLTLEISRPYAGASVALLVAVAGLSILGFVASRGGEPLFGRPILD
jgi:Protein kinase domain